jgi:hypothetical protein
MNLFIPLFADVGDVIRILVILLIFVVPVIGQLIAKIRQIPPPDKRPLPPRPAPANMADQIEEFMRRAIQHPPEEQARPAAQASRAEVVMASPAIEPIRAEAVDQSLGGPMGGQLSDHVKTYLDEQKFERREVDLGKEISQVDQAIGQHLRQVFDHRVSEMEPAKGAAAVAVAYEPPDLVGAMANIPQTFATGLLDRVVDPDSLREAIILSEILQRPEERWG